MEDLFGAREGHDYDRQHRHLVCIAIGDDGWLLESSER